MKVLVFGASGKVGSMLIKELLERGHQVTAFVYGNAEFDKRIKVIKGDVKNLNDVSNALNGANVVVSALGSWGTKSKDILSGGMKNIIPEMKKQGIKRIISLTGADALLPSEKPEKIQSFTRPIIKLLAGKILADGEDHLRQLTESDLDWTVVRSPVMTNSTKEKYVLNSIRCQPWQTVSRLNVAKSMVDVLESTQYNKQAPYIHNGDG